MIIKQKRDGTFVITASAAELGSLAGSFEGSTYHDESSNCQAYGWPCLSPYESEQMGHKLHSAMEDYVKGKGGKR